MPQCGEQNQRSGHERSGSHVTRRYKLLLHAAEPVFADHSGQKAAEFRRIAYQLYEKGTDPCVNAVLKRMSPPKSLDYRIACEVLAEVKQKILSNGKTLGK